MAIAAIGTLIHNNAKAAGSNGSWIVDADFNVDECAVIIVASDNTQTTDGDGRELRIEDSGHNPWIRVIEFINGQGGAAAGATVAAFYCKCRTKLIGGTDEITLWYDQTARTAKALTGHKFSVGPGKTFRRAGSPVTLANDGVDAGSMSISGLTSREYLWIRGGGIESSTTTYTPSTNYTAFTHVTANSTTAGSTSATNMGARGEYRIFTGTGDTTDPTTSSADQASIYFALYEVDDTTVSDPVVQLADVSASGSATTVSVTIPGTSLGLLSVEVTYGTSITSITVTDNAGRTWDEIAHVDFGTIATPLRRLAIYRSQQAADSTGTITIDGGANAGTFGYCISTCLHAYYGNDNGAAAIVQSVTNRADNSKSVFATLAAFQTNKRNMGYCAGASTESTDAGYPNDGWREPEQSAVTGTNFEMITSYSPSVEPLNAGIILYGSVTPHVGTIAIEIATSVSDPPLSQIRLPLSLLTM